MAKIMVHRKRWQIRLWFLKIYFEELDPIVEEKSFPNREAGKPSVNPQTVKKGDHNEKE